MDQLNKDICLAHEMHYKHSPTGLICPIKSPNGNPIYHLFSSGEITWQKGGNGYRKHSEFTFEHKLPNVHKLMLSLPLLDSGVTYAILTREECTYFRNQMIELLKD